MGTRRCAVVALSLLALAGCGPVLAGCGQGVSTSQPGGTVSTPPSGSPSPEASPSGADPSGTPRSSLTPRPGTPTTAKTPAPGEVILEGTFVDGVENCIVLRTDSGKTYEILGGDPALHRVGTRVIVRGVIRTDMASFCMQGPIVQVSELRRA